MFDKEAPIETKEEKGANTKPEEFKAAEPEEVSPESNIGENVIETPENVIKAPEHVPEKSEVAPAQQDTQEEAGVEGQMEWTTDFPEYIPKDYVVASDGTEVLPAKIEKTQYPKYEIKKGEFGYELYDDDRLLVVCRSESNAMLIMAIMEKESKAISYTDYHFTKTDSDRFFGVGNE